MYVLMPRKLCLHKLGSESLITNTVFDGRMKEQPTKLQFQVSQIVDCG